MPSGRWSLGRVALIWCAWPILLVAATVVLMRVTGVGLSIDLVHLRSDPVAALPFVLVLIGPPLAATWLWGRRRGSSERA